MQIFALKPSRLKSTHRLLQPRLGAAIALALLAIPCLAQDDPPDEAGRVSFISGTVSVQPNGSDDWGQAYPNSSIGPGDRIFTDQDGQAEIQVGQSYLRIGPNTDITFVEEQPGDIAFGMAQGSVHVRSFGFEPGQSFDISTPNGDTRLSEPGELRADVMPGDGVTIFTTMGNDAFVSGAGGFGQPMGPWQSLEVAGTNPVSPQWLQPNGPDELDQWSQQRDRMILNAASFRYVNPDVPGAYELDASGEWLPDSDYGPMWFPRDVPAGWAPYHYGHWVNREPWGWVWVEDEPWGYAPFHYGRWILYRNRWGWVPGPREERPVWSPALVVFAGGGGAGISAWFPLGPGEPYRPWYPCSPRYIDRVNITNIHESRIVHVQTTYVNIVNVRNVTNITYVNRTAGVTAMRQEDFAAGRPVRQAAVEVNRAQFDHVQVVDRPAPVTRQSFISRPVAHPVPVSGFRPTFINRQGMQISARPGAMPQPAPMRPVQTVRALPGRMVVNPPPGAQYPNRGENGRPMPNQPGPPMPGNGGRPPNYPNQPPANNSYGQQPHPAPIAPGVEPSGRPLPPSRGQQEGNPNPSANPRFNNNSPNNPPPQNEHRGVQQPPPNFRNQGPSGGNNANQPPPPQPEHQNVQPPPPNFRNQGPPPQPSGHNANQPPPPRGGPPENRNDNKKDQKKDDKKPQ